MKTSRLLSKPRFKHSLLALPLLVAGACAPTAEEPIVEEPVVQEVEPLLKGSLGNVIDFEGVPEVTGYQDQSYLFLDVRTRGVDWAAMTGLHLFGTLGEGEFAVGKRVSLERTDVWSDEPRLDMIGCSGYRDGDWDYDCHPDAIELQISDGRAEGEFRLDLVASFDDDCDGDDDDDDVRQPVEATFFVSGSALNPPVF